MKFFLHFHRVLSRSTELHSAWPGQLMGMTGVLICHSCDYHESDDANNNNIPQRVANYCIVLL